jgi:hypothetical protein
MAVMKKTLALAVAEEGAVRDSVLVTLGGPLP